MGAKFRDSARKTWASIKEVTEMDQETKEHVEALIRIGDDGCPHADLTDEDYQPRHKAAEEPVPAKN